MLTLRFRGAGLTTLASALTVLAGTDGGDAFFSQLQEDDRTVFAPTNEAFTSAGFPENFSTAAPEDLDVDMLRQVLLYHIVSDDVTDDTIAVSPANTVVDTLLEGGANSPAINFGDDQSVPLVLTRESDSADGFSIFNNGEPIAVTGDATEVGNLQLYTIDQLIPLPPSLAELAESAGLTELAGALTSANLLEALNGSTGGLTIFAPNDAAFQAIASDIEGLDDATVATVLQNHVVNGTAAFSDDIDIEDGDDNDDDDSDDVTPLAGEPLTFTMMDETIMVNSGDATANIVATDYIFNGGVVHVSLLKSIFSRAIRPNALPQLHCPIISALPSSPFCRSVTVNLKPKLNIIGHRRCPCQRRRPGQPSSHRNHQRLPIPNRHQRRGR